MKPLRILSLDMSSKTGWSVQTSSDEGLALEAYGVIAKTSEPKGTYPETYVRWAYSCFIEVVSLIDTYAPDVLVIEETASGSKNNYDQKILEWIHFLVARLITQTKIEAKYYMTEEWRRIVGCNKMSDADKKRNKEVREYKKKHPTSKLARDINNKVIGLVGKKHLNVRKANELYGKYLKEPLIMKNEDEADALLLAASFHIKRLEEKL